MFLVRRPCAPAIERFVEESQHLPLSYGNVGIAQASAAGYDLDETTVTVGQGEEAFERARAALVAWKHFDFNWVEVWPPTPSVSPGTSVAVLIRHFGFWSLNGCRVVYALGDRWHGETFGFAYGTLSNHAERGEEIFEVSHRAHSDEVVYRIRAASQPRAVLARVGYPLVRRLQAQFRRDSGAAMRRAVAHRAP
jgi:uncharacterized protein (UPF0548 family)